MTIDAGTCVIAYLGAPREQVFGAVLSINSAGMTLRCITLASVEDWMRELTADSEGGTQSFGLSTTFYPMHRIEKVVVDESAHGAQSIQDWFLARMGFSFDEYIGRLGG